MHEIILSDGTVAKVDDGFEYLSQYKWFPYRPKDRPGLVYAVSRMGGKKVVRLHRVVMGFNVKGPMIDHLNGDGIDCRRDNLVATDHRKNGRNRSSRSNRDNKTSSFLGVSFSRGGWIARIRNGSRWHYLGKFKTEREAASARAKAELAMWGINERRKEALEIGGR